MPSGKDGGVCTFDIACLLYEALFRPEQRLFLHKGIFSKEVEPICQNGIESGEEKYIRLAVALLNSQNLISYNSICMCLFISAQINFLAKKGET